MTAPTIPICPLPDAHPTTCPCPTPEPVVQVRRPRVGTLRTKRVEDVEITIDNYDETSAT